MATRLRLEADKAAIALDMGVRPFLALGLDFCVVLLATFDQCFFSIAARTGLWTEDELDLSEGIFDESAYQRLAGSPKAPPPPPPPHVIGGWGASDCFAVP